MNKENKKIVALIKNSKRESYKDIHGFFDWEDLYESLADQLKDNHVFVEVGVWCGRSVCFLGEQLKKRQKKPQIYAVDTFKGSKDEAGAVAIIKKLGGSLLPIFEENLKSLGLEDLITPIEKDSVEASLEFEDYSVAAAFIDANHSYEGVTKDLEAWWPKLKKGGWLFGHDLCGEGVARAVAEFFHRKDPTLKVGCCPPNTWAVRKPLETTPEVGCLKINLLKGEKQISVLVPAEDQTWGGTIAGLQKGEFNFFDLKPKAGSHIIDFGCNVGVISLMCATLYPECHIHSYDPCGICISLLKQSCEINEINNLTCYHSCVTASSKEEVEFSHESLGPTCFIASDLVSVETHPYKGININNIHIKDILSSMDNIAFLKMDIEGGEWGIFDYLYENMPNFPETIERVHIEIHGEKERCNKLIKKLESSFPDKKNMIRL